MHETDASVPRPGEGPDAVAEPTPGADAGTVPADSADTADLAAFETDFDTVDAALEALDADDLDGAEALVASLTVERGEPADDGPGEAPGSDIAEPPSAPAG